MYVAWNFLFFSGKIGKELWPMLSHQSHVSLSDKKLLSFQFWAQQCSSLLLDAHFCLSAAARAQKRRKSGGGIFLAIAVSLLFSHVQFLSSAAEVIWCPKGIRSLSSRDKNRFRPLGPHCEEHSQHIELKEAKVPNYLTREKKKKGVRYEFL